MREYAVKFLRKAYELINPDYARDRRDRRMAKLGRLEESGKLEGMCTSEIHKLFGIIKESDEF